MVILVGVITWNWFLFVIARHNRKITEGRKDGTDCGFRTGTFLKSYVEM